ncbi:MAG: hypothetical protein C0467_29390 [Planctomycetaceae bacterium]|nr:hypothetical protein [Planctomycetaceae bacterium]
MFPAMGLGPPEGGPGGPPGPLGIGGMGPPGIAPPGIAPPINSACSGKGNLPSGSSTKQSVAVPGGSNLVS